MKKMYLILFTMAVFIAFAYVNKAKKNISFFKRDSPIERFNFYKKKLHDNTLMELKKGVFSNKLKKYSENTLYLITNHILSEVKNSSLKKEKLNDTIFTVSKTYKQQIEYVDQLFQNNHIDYEFELINLFFPNWSYIKEITHIENNIITLYWSPGQSLISDRYQFLWIKNGQVIDLGNGYNQLLPDELLFLKETISNSTDGFAYISSCSEVFINKKGKDTFTVTFYALAKNDYETSPSIEITYETNDFKTIVPNSIQVCNLELEK